MQLNELLKDTNMQKSQKSGSIMPSGTESCLDADPYRQSLEKHVKRGCIDMAKRDIGMITIIPNYDYEGQNETVKEKLCEHDYKRLRRKPQTDKVARG